MTKQENLKNVLFIFVTDRCNMGCDFCMCKDVRGNDDLTVKGKVKENLAGLISESYKTAISGQGDPLLNQIAVFEILNIPGSKRNFEIRTSGNIPRVKFAAFIDKVNQIMKQNGDHCKLYLSLDEYHIQKLKHDNLAYAVELFVKNNYDSTSLAFRSILTNKEFVKKYIEDKLSAKHSIGWREVDPLHQKLIINNREFSVYFRSMVGSLSNASNDVYKLERYIDILEEHYYRPFTLGNVPIPPEKVGLNVTVNPNGDVFLYGTEFEPLGNVNRDNITYRTIRKFVQQDPICSTLLTVPFKDILHVLRKDSQMSRVIDKINNSHWIVRTLNSVCPDKLKAGILAAKEYYDATVSEPATKDV